VVVKRLLAVLVGSAVIAVGAFGCGEDEQKGTAGGSGDRQGATQGAGDGKADRGGGDAKQPRDGRDGGSAGSYQPAEPGDRYAPEQRDGKIEGDDGSIERFGESVADDEADDVVAVAVGYYDALAGRDWERACGLLSQEVRQHFDQLAEGAPQLTGNDCADMISTFAGGSRQALRRQAREIRFNEVRVEGDRAFAIFKSKSIPNGLLPLVRENGQWKVNALTGASL
jgi:hypothetical protein